MKVRVSNIVSSMCKLTTKVNLEWMARVVVYQDFQRTPVESQIVCFEGAGKHDSTMMACLSRLNLTWCYLTDLFVVVLTDFIFFWPQRVLE